MAKTDRKMNILPVLIAPLILAVAALAVWGIIRVVSAPPQPGEEVYFRELYVLLDQSGSLKEKRQDVRDLVKKTIIAHLRLGDDPAIYQIGEYTRKEGWDGKKCEIIRKGTWVKAFEGLRDYKDQAWPKVWEHLKVKQRRHEEDVETSMDLMERVPMPSTNLQSPYSEALRNMIGMVAASKSRSGGQEIERVLVVIGDFVPDEEGAGSKVPETKRDALEGVRTVFVCPPNSGCSEVDTNIQHWKTYLGEYGLVEEEGMFDVYSFVSLQPDDLWRPSPAPALAGQRQE